MRYKKEAPANRCQPDARNQAQRWTAARQQPSARPPTSWLPRLPARLPAHLQCHGSTSGSHPAFTALNAATCTSLFTVPSRLPCPMS